MHKLLNLFVIATTLGSLSIAQAEGFAPTYTPKRKANCVSLDNLKTKWAELGFVANLGFDAQQSKLICIEPTHENGYPSYFGLRSR